MRSSIFSSMTGRYAFTISVRGYVRKSFTVGTPCCAGLGSNSTQTALDRVAMVPLSRSRRSPNRDSRTVCERQHTALIPSIPVRALAGQVMTVTANRWVAWPVVGTADGVGRPVDAQGWQPRTRWLRRARGALASGPGSGACCRHAGAASVPGADAVTGGWLSRAVRRLHRPDGRPGSRSQVPALAKAARCSGICPGSRPGRPARARDCGQPHCPLRCLGRVAGAVRRRRLRRWPPGCSR